MFYDGEIVNKLSVVVEQANQEGKQYICDFYNKLISDREKNAELIEYFYKSATFDSADEKDVMFFTYMLDANCSLDWYKLVQHTYYEPKDDKEKYYKAYKTCMNRKIDVNDLFDMYDESNNANELCDKVLAYFCDDKSDDKGEKTILEKDNYKEEKKEAVHYEEFIHQKDSLIEQQNKIINQLQNDIGRLNQINKRLDDNNQEFEEKISNLYDELLAAKKDVWKNRLETEHIKKERLSNELALKLSKETNEKYLDKIEILEKENIKLTDKIEKLENKEKTLEETNTNFKEEIANLKKEIDIQKKGVHEKNYNMELENYMDNFNEMAMEEDSDYENDAPIPTEIKDGIEQLEKKSNWVARIYSKFQEKMYQKKQVTEQENLIFIKMMELNFSKKKLQIVKNNLHDNLILSRVDIYKFISKDPSEEALMQYFDVAA